LSSFFFLYTDGKNSFRKGSIDVTPPDQNKTKHYKMKLKQNVQKSWYGFFI
jgi:hypothetical protein